MKKRSSAADSVASCPPVLMVTNALAFLPGKGYVEGMDILCSGGKIRALRRGLKAPAGAEIFDAAGAPVTPGLIDAHTHLGMKELGDGDVNEKSDPVMPFLDARDAVNPWQPEFFRALMNGITTVMVTPGSTNLVGGTAVLMKTRGHVLDAMILKHHAAMKMALGQNPKRAYGEKGRMPGSRMGSAYLLRKAFHEARAYRAKRARRGGNRPETDHGKERLLDVLDGKIPAKIHCHRADDIMTALRLADEFGFRFTLDHVTEAFRMTDELARRKVDCILGPYMNVYNKPETRWKGYHNPVALRAAGLRFALTTDHSVDPCWHLPVTAGLAVREGLAPDDALRAITEWPAAIVGLDKRVGMLKAGLDADLVVWDGDPLKLARPVAVVVDGCRVRDAERED